MNSKAIIAIIVLVILGGGIWYMQGITPPPAPAPAPAPVTEPAPVAETAPAEPVATGKVDDILASLDHEQQFEDTNLIMSGDGSADTVLSDGTTINDLSQTYDETQL